MTLRTDEQIVLEALDHAENCEIGPLPGRAKLAFQNILARTVPKLPPDVTGMEIIYRLSYRSYSCYVGHWADVSRGYSREGNGDGQTIREACEMALEEYGEYGEDDG